MRGGEVLVVNAGSTSLKLHLVDAEERSEPVGEIESLDAERLAAVAHRVVHGGELRDPVLIDGGVRERIFESEPLAPLHNRPCLVGLERAQKALPDVPQVAVFDTGFHATIPAEAAVYPLPRRWREEWGVRRYGFHGLSVAWSAERAPQLLGRPRSGLRLVVCHLGGGCSVSAVRDARSVDNTMGFSPLEGVPMTTRSGSLDPGVLIYLIRERGLDAAALEQALNFDSGLRGLAGGSGGMGEVERAAAGGAAGARLAIDVFAHRVAAAVAAMAASAGGIDALVFTAGIGERSAGARERICERLAFLGVELDRERNAAAGDREIGDDASSVRVLVVHAREELVAARAARALLSIDRAR